MWVKRNCQRRGIATALWTEAQRRWNCRWENQRFTPDGAAFMDAYLSKTGCEDSPV